MRILPVALALLIVPLFAFGDDMPVVWPGFEWIDSVIAFIKDAGTGIWMGVITAVVEFILRLFKTEKPKSILLLVAWLLEKLSQVSLELSILLNRVIPQRLK